MKKLLMLIIIILSGLISQSQVTYNSSWTIKGSSKFESKIKDRIITISDNEISISNFIGGTETQYLVVNKIIDKDWGLDGVCKTYYCTTKDADIINGYQKVIIYTKYDTMIMAMFADEITVFTYKFNLKK